MIFRNYKKENEKLRKENEHYIEVLRKLNELYSDINVKCDFTKFDEKNKMYFELKNTRKQDLLYATNKCKMIVKYTVNSIEMDK